MSTNAEQALNYASAVTESRRQLVELYAKPLKTNADWSLISQLKTVTDAGTAAAQLHATLAVVDGLRELCRRLPATQPADDAERLV